MLVVAPRPAAQPLAVRAQQVPRPSEQTSDCNQDRAESYLNARMCGSSSRPAGRSKNLSCTLVLSTEQPPWQPLLMTLLVCLPFQVPSEMLYQPQRHLMLVPCRYQSSKMVWTTADPVVVLQMEPPLQPVEFLKDLMKEPKLQQNLCPLPSLAAHQYLSQFRYRLCQVPRILREMPLAWALLGLGGGVDFLVLTVMVMRGDVQQVQNRHHTKLLQLLDQIIEKCALPYQKQTQRQLLE